jgi:hypothetical protein
MGTSTGCAIRSSQLLSKRAVFHPTCVRASLILFKQGLGACDGDGPIAAGPQHLNDDTLHRVPATPTPDEHPELPGPSPGRDHIPHWVTHPCGTSERLIPEGRLNLFEIR